MSNQEIISIYEAVAEITDEMLLAARSGNWEQLALLESRCAGHVESLQEVELSNSLPLALRERKVKILKKILADDREIRSITQPWMAKLSILINSTGAERKLSQQHGTLQTS
jgi:flagellar protein FliT